MYDTRTKGAALAMLLTGDTTRYVSKRLGIPRTTLRRWQAEVRPWLPRLSLPGFDFSKLVSAMSYNPGGSSKTALKKEAADALVYERLAADALAKCRELP
jgi:hypothetical protein